MNSHQRRKLRRWFKYGYTPEAWEVMARAMTIEKWNHYARIAAGKRLLRVFR